MIIISQSFMAGKRRRKYLKEQDCLNYDFQVIITNSPHTGINARVNVVSGHTIARLNNKTWFADNLSLQMGKILPLTD